MDNLKPAAPLPAEQQHIIDLALAYAQARVNYALQAERKANPAEREEALFQSINAFHELYWAVTGEE